MYSENTLRTYLWNKYSWNQILLLNYSHVYLYDFQLSKSFQLEWIHDHLAIVIK
jgi:hypothetical protein